MINKYIFSLYLISRLVFMPVDDVPEFDPYQQFPPPSQDQIESLPALLSWYDWNEGGINCDRDCSVMGSGLHVDDSLYGKVAACPSGMTKSIDNGSTTSVTFYNEFTVLCADSGGAISVSYRPVYMVDVNDTVWQWVVVFDVAWDSSIPPPWWQWNLTYDWYTGIGYYSEID